MTTTSSNPEDIDENVGALTGQDGREPRRRRRRILTASALVVAVLAGYTTWMGRGDTHQ